MPKMPKIKPFWTSSCPHRGPPRRRAEVSNAVRTAGYMRPENLRHYALLWGSVK